MKRENGLTLTALVITIIILLVLAGVSLRFIVGENGVIEKATTVEAEYNKSEVLEELNLIITEKYLDAYKKATKAGKDAKIEQYYNSEKVIKFLKGYSGGESGEDYTVQDSKIIIEDLVGSTDEYFIRISELNKDISSYAKGKNEENSKDFFFIKKESEDVYKVYYRNSRRENEEIGALQLQPQV